MVKLCLYPYCILDIDAFLFQYNFFLPLKKNIYTMFGKPEIERVGVSFAGVDESY